MLLAWQVLLDRLRWLLDLGLGYANMWVGGLRDWLDKAWSSNHGAVYRWLKDGFFMPLVTTVVRPDVTPTVNLREMGGLLQDAWWPINRKYADTPEPDLVAFLRRCRHHVWCVPMLASLLPGSPLRQGLVGMHPSALGLYGWSLTDLRSLADYPPDWMRDLLREVERLARWLAHLAEGYMALIPKEGLLGPLNTQPLTILSMVYFL